ncbi:MAG: VRR-NUC domain-containing protein [Treponema sp.]|nr:VRR-NUC domain-containing protein [Treponema sp.]
MTQESKMGEYMNRSRHKKEQEGAPVFKVREADVLRAVSQWLALKRIPHWRQNSGALKNAHGQLVRFGKKDSADFTGIDPKTGRRLEIECKAPGEKLRESQRQFLDMINRCCGVGVCVHSVEELEERLKEAGII